jgi:LysM repeat protein
MQTRSNAPRVIAVLALLTAVIALLVVISDSLSGDSGSRPSTTRIDRQAHQRGAKKEDKKPDSYVVQSGDTLSSIAARTGVSVEQIQRLNPAVDPQILISGQKLKLR